MWSGEELGEGKGRGGGGKGAGRAPVQRRPRRGHDVEAELRGWEGGDARVLEAGGEARDCVSRVAH